MKKVAIIVDDVIRDLGPLSLLSIELKKIGIEPFLVPLRIQHLEIKKIKPDYILLNYLRKQNEFYASGYAEAGIKLGLLDQEGGAFIDFEKFESLRLTKNLSLRESVDQVFFWNNEIYEYAEKNGWFPKAKKIITGHPKYDTYYINNQKISKQTNKSKFLFLTSFTLANPRLLSPEQEIKSWLASGGNEDYVRDLQNKHKFSFNLFINTFKELLQKYPNNFFELKIHPFENSEVYYENFSNYKNLIITHNQTLIKSLKNAKYVFHSSSTTSFESLLSDVMPINLKFLENPFKIELVENISFNCNSIQDLKEIIENKKDNELNLKLHECKNIVDRLIHHYGSSSRTIAENINICLEESRDIDFKVLEKYNIIKSNRIINLLKKILYFFGIPEDFSFRKFKSQYEIWQKSTKYFDENLVHSRLDEMGFMVNGFKFKKNVKRSVSVKID